VFVDVQYEVSEIYSSKYLRKFRKKQWRLFALDFFLRRSIALSRLSRR